MNRRERVMAALRHETTDIVPYDVEFTSQAAEAVAAALGDAEFSQKLGNHLAVIGYHGNKQPMAGRPGYFIDDFGVVWNCTGADRDIGVVEEPLIKEPSLQGIQLPAVDETWFREYFSRFSLFPSDRFRFVMVGFSMFERAWSMRGMQELLLDMLMHEEFVDELFGQLCERNLRIVDLALECDIDGVFFGDDWGKQAGMIMGPERWRRLLKTHQARLYERVKSAGKIVAQHSCGDIQEIFPDLIEIGLDAYQTVMPEIYDLPALKREYGKDLSFWGAISAQNLLPHGTPDEVREQTAHTLRVMGAGGGYIAGPTHTVTHDVPVENVLAMLDVLQHQSNA